MSGDVGFDRIFTLAFELSRAGDDRDAERLYQLLIERAAERPETSPAPALYNLGMLYRRTGEVGKAVAPLRRAAELEPQNAWYRFALGMVLLSLGAFEEGWRHYDARNELPQTQGAKPEGVPEWNGQDLSGRSIVMIREQGFGDEIQFSRFVPDLARRGARVLLLCAPALERLFQHNFQVEVRGAEGRVGFAAPDYWIRGCSAARWLGMDLASIRGEPYMSAPNPRPHPGGRLRVGLAVKGRPTHFNDSDRSMPDAAAAALRAMPAHVVSLAPEESGARDFAETADLIASLDLVVTVDTSVAHLAGAMGKPCWVMLPFANTDWRWLRERTDCPWYGSMRLYRQPAPADWGAVIGAVLRDLQLFREGLGR